MKKYTFFIYSLLFLVLGTTSGIPAQAQQQQNSQYALYNYRNDGEFNAWLNIDIDSITYSRFDLDGIEHDEIVVQEVWTPDSLYRIPMEAIDSIGFRAPATEFKVGVFIIDEKHMPYISGADTHYVIFKHGTPSNMMPVKGQVIYSDLTDDPFYMGFAGRVVEIEQLTDGIKYICEAVSPNEVYEKCIDIFKISSDDNNIIQVNSRQRTANRVIRRNIADDGIISVPSLKFSVQLNDKYEKINLDAKVSYTIDYAFSVGFTDKDFASLKVTRETEWSANCDVKLEKFDYSKEEWLPWPIYTLGAGKRLGFSVNVGLFFDCKGSIELSAKVPYKSTKVDHYTWSSDDPFQHIGYETGGWPSLDDFVDNASNSEVKLKAKGSVAFGPVIEASFQVWKPSFFSIDARAKGGLELSGELSLNLVDIISEGFDAYKTVSEDMKITTGLKIGGEIGYTVKDKFNKIIGAETTLFKTERYFFPRFTMPKLPEYTSNGWEGDCNPMSVFSQPSNLLFFPGKVGLGVYDENNTFLGSMYSDNLYFGGDKEDWEKKWLQLDISQYAKKQPTGSKLNIRPLFNILGIKEIKGSPNGIVTIPSSISLKDESIKMGIGDIRDIAIIGGWGNYSIVNKNPKFVFASIDNHGGNGLSSVKVEAKSQGNAIVKIIDLRSGEEATLHVEVSNKLGTIFINAEKIDFGTVKEGEDKTEYFSVVNSGKGDLKFTVEKASAPFNIPEAGTEYFLAPGDTKVFAVTCSGFSAEEGNKTQFIHINSNATNASPDFGITLTAKGGKAEKLALSTSSLTMTVGESKTVEITSGSGEYGVTNLNGDKAKATLNGTTITIEALSVGDAKVVVTDMKSGLKVTIEISVTQKTVYPELTLSKQEVHLNVGETGQIEITSGTGSYSIVKYDTNVAKVTINGSTITINALSIGNTPVTITDKGSGKTATFGIAVKKPSIYDKDAVDLGLSVKWAKMNVGAVSEEDYGEHYAWGETESKSYFSWSSYAYCNGTPSTITKYNSHDGKTTLDPADDAANIVMGGDWYTPTKAEMDELKDRCQWKLETLNGEKVYRVTGPNGKSIVLPLGGNKTEDTWNNLGSMGCYSVSTLSSEKTALGLSCHGETREYKDYQRYIGLSIRAVLRK